MTFFFLMIFLYWFVRGTDLLIGILFRIPRLENTASVKIASPKVSILFAAKNEEIHIRDAVEKLLAQDYPDFEVIAVNDRSDDRTPAILESIRHPRLKVAHITRLPKGWLGKTHALYEGQRVSSGEWILFTDADVKMQPQALTLAMKAAHHHALDSLSLFPKVELKSYLEIVFMSYFSLVFNMRFRPWAARSKSSKSYVGIGAFHLLRRSVYEKIGTHESIKLDIADDMMLGKRVKAAGFHQMALFGGPAVSVRWVEGAKGVFNSLHKNGFRGLNYNFLFLMVVTIGMFAVDVLPFAALFFLKGSAWAFPAAAVLMIGLIYAAGAFKNPVTFLAFPAHAFGSLIFAFILWRSALSALISGGVGWRGTHYSLKDLKAASTNL